MRKHFKRVVMGRKVLEHYYHGILNCNISPSFTLLGIFIDLTRCLWLAETPFSRVMMQSACHCVLACFIAFNFY